MDITHRYKSLEVMYALASHLGCYAPFPVVSQYLIVQSHIIFRETTDFHTMSFIDFHSPSKEGWISAFKSDSHHSVGV